MNNGQEGRKCSQLKCISADQTDVTTEYGPGDSKINPGTGLKKPHYSFLSVQARTNMLIERHGEQMAQDAAPVSDCIFGNLSDLVWVNRQHSPHDLVQEVHITIPYCHAFLQFQGNILL
jgi:hypothetical protein